jgi:hypothetical protein
MIDDPPRGEVKSCSAVNSFEQHDRQAVFFQDIAGVVVGLGEVGLVILSLWILDRVLKITA